MSDAPPKKLDVRVGDDARTLTMSYAMLQEVMRLSGALEASQMNALITNFVARDLVVRRLLTDVKRPIENEDELVSAFDLDLEPETVDAIIAWAAEHTGNFFIRQLKVAEELGKKFEATKEA